MSDPFVPAAAAGTAAARSASGAALASRPAGDLAELRRRLAPLRQRLVQHALYARLESAPDLRLFAEHHVFAVWDFMSLLKALQREFTSVEVPWSPKGRPQVRRFVNERVLAAESDRLPDGRVLSHLELYRSAMTELGAESGPLEQFTADLARGASVPEALVRSGAPCHARSFVQTTWRILRSHSVPAVAAAFALGREEVIPDMFAALVKNLGRRAGLPVADLLLYLERQVEFDGEQHGPLSQQLLLDVLGDCPEAWTEAELAARQALKARLALWDGVLAQLEGAGPPRC